MVELTPTCTRTSWTKDLTVLQQDSCPNPFLLGILFLQITLFFSNTGPRSKQMGCFIPAVFGTLAGCSYTFFFRRVPSVSGPSQSVFCCPITTFLLARRTQEGWAGRKRNEIPTNLLLFARASSSNFGGGKERGSLLYTMDTRVPFAAWYN